MPSPSVLRIGAKASSHLSLRKLQPRTHFSSLLSRVSLGTRRGRHGDPPTLARTTGLIHARFLRSRVDRGMQQRGFLSAPISSTLMRRLIVQVPGSSTGLDEFAMGRRCRRLHVDLLSCLPNSDYLLFPTNPILFINRTD